MLSAEKSKSVKALVVDPLARIGDQIVAYRLRIERPTCQVFANEDGNVILNSLPIGCSISPRLSANDLMCNQR